jgi:hypothetical protein
VQRYRIDDKMLATEHTADRALLLLRAGYEWHPRGVGGYIFPWAGAAITHEVSGDAGAYAQWPVVPYVTLDLGWRY